LGTAGKSPAEVDRFVPGYVAAQNMAKKRQFHRTTPTKAVKPARWILSRQEPGPGRVEQAGPARNSEDNLSEALATELSRYYDGIRARFPEIQDREVAQAASLFFRRLLAPPKNAGRPRLESVTKATELQKRGKSWTYIYKVAIPAYSTMRADERFHARYNLKHAVQMRLRRERQQMAKAIRSTKMHEGDFVHLHRREPSQS